MTSKTITLTGGEQKIVYGAGCNAWLRNDGTTAVNASCSAGISAGGDGIVSIPAGQSAPVFGANGTVYMLGKGSVQLIGSDYSANPFKTSAPEPPDCCADETARAAINSHSANAEIHVTASEKNAWNGKADKSDIPEKLPADGGNADTVKSYPISLSGEKGIPVINADNGTLEIGQRIDFHSANGQDYAIRLFVAPSDWDSGETQPCLKTITSDGTITNINDGGNAASVGGYSAEQIMVSTDRVITGNYDNLKTPGVYYGVCLSSSTNVPVSSGNGILCVFATNECHNGLAQMYIRKMDTGKTVPKIYVRVYSSTMGGWSDWGEISSDGNAATLDTHPASDFVLKSDYDALAARVAALEGGT